MGLGLRISIAKQAGLAVAGLLVFASPALAVCPSPGTPIPITASGSFDISGDEAYTVVAPIGGTGLEFTQMGGPPVDTLALTNGQTITSSANGIDVSGVYGSVCYDGLAGGNIIAAGDGLSVSQAGDGDALLTIAHAITADRGVFVDHSGNGDAIVTMSNDIDAQSSGIEMVHSGLGGDVSITTSAGTTISAHGGTGPMIYAMGNVRMPVGIYVDRSGAEDDSAITVTNGADISADGVGIYVDVCSCGSAVTTIDIQSVGTIDVVDGAGIYVSQGGRGDTTVAQSGKVTALDGEGVVIDQYGRGDISASVTGGIDAVYAGLVITQFDVGDITATAGGVYNIADGEGIVITQGGKGDVDLTSTATINSAYDAITVDQIDGNVTLTQTGDLTVDEGAGILVGAYGDGDVAVSMSGDIDASDGGIGVLHVGETGDVKIVTTTGSSITAYDGVGPLFGLGPTGIYVERSQFGPVEGTGDIEIINGADIDAESAGIVASLCSCTAGDLKVTSTGDIHIGDTGGWMIYMGVNVTHEGDGKTIVDVPGTITVDHLMGLGIVVSKAGGGDVDVTTGDVTAPLYGVSVAAVEDADISIKANGDITANRGLGISTTSLGRGDVTIATAGDVTAREAAIAVTHVGPRGDVDVSTAAGGKLTGSGGAATYAGIPVVGTAGIAVSTLGRGKVSIANNSDIDVDGVGIYADTCSCIGGLDIRSSGDIDAPYGIVGTTSADATLHLTGGTITGTNGVSLLGTTIVGTIAAAAKIEIGGSGAGRYGAAFVGDTDLTLGGTIDAAGTDALLFSFGDAELTLLPGFVIHGQVRAMDAYDNGLILGGATGDGSFDLDRVDTEFTGFDTLGKTGNSTWTLSGSAFTGTLTADAGTVIVNSDIPGLDLVLDNTTLKGNSTLKSLTTKGGTVAPGNSIGTVVVAGDTTIGAGTLYDVEVNAAGASDKLEAGGTVSIDATADVVATMEPGSYGDVTKYTIVTGATGVAGAFEGVSGGSAFYTPTLTYDANNVYLTLTRNTLSLDDFATTPNQKAAAAALDGSGFGAPYFDELFVLPAGDVPDALDALSGDGYASVTSAALDDGRFVRDAALDRRGGRGVWATPYGGVSRLPGDGNGPAVDHATGGLLLGADGEVGEGWLGVLLGYGQSRYDVPARNTTATSGEFSLGTYGGAEWNAFYASFGAAITGRDIDATRRVVFPGVDDTFRAEYASLTAQAFAELGYRIDLGGTTITPFGGLAGLQSATTGYTETGAGGGALSVGPSTATALVTTLGLRLEHEIALDDDKTLTLRASAAWRHAIGKASTNTTIGGAAFTVAGAPLAADTIDVSAGTSLAMGQLSIGLDYTGSFGSGGISNAATATLAGQF